MQTLSFHKPWRRNLVAVHVCLPLAAAITAALVFMISPSGARSETVTVIDNTLPVISNPVASLSTLWPPNREMVDVTVSYQATDNCAMRVTKLSVSSNDPDAGSTEADWEVVDAHRVRLRAKRTARHGARSTRSL